MLDPFCAEKEIRDRINEAGAPYDSKLDLNTLIKLYNDYPNVSVRLVSHNIYGAIFFTEDCMIYDPYHLGRIATRIENRFLALEIIPSEQHDGKQPFGYYKILAAHFTALWQVSESFEEWIGRHSGQLPTELAKKIRPRYNLGLEHHG